MNVLNVYCRCGHDKIHHLACSSCRATSLPGLAAAKSGGGGFAFLGGVFSRIFFSLFGFVVFVWLRQYTSIAKF